MQMVKKRPTPEPDETRVLLLPGHFEITEDAVRVRKCGGGKGKTVRSHIGVPREFDEAIESNFGVS